MTRTISLDFGSATARCVLVGEGLSVVTGNAGVPRAMPVSIPASQVYYWTRTWQEGERKALEDLEAGRSQTFNDPRELARYLLRPGD